MSLVCNLGSLNIDYVYQVPHLVRAGETLASSQRAVYAGGKGANQSVALARAGAAVCHLGALGDDGMFIRELLQQSGVDCQYLQHLPGASGHAIIQVSAGGENSIILHGGANQAIPLTLIKEVIAALPAGAVLLAQNESNGIAEAMHAAQRRGLPIWFNPAPFSPQVLDLPLHLVDTIIVNESEAAALGQCETEDPAQLLPALRARLPQATIILTLGAHGVTFSVKDEPDQVLHVPAQKVAVVDTTAAGDTFIGYTLAALLAGETMYHAIERGCRAAAITVSRPGAIVAIPTTAEIE